MTQKEPATTQDSRHIAEMQKNIETITDPALKATFKRVMDCLKDTRIEKDVEEFQKEATNAPAKEEQRVLAFLPHQLAKTSIFFPMSDKELNEENRRISRIEQETGWGKVVVEGIKLAIFEEDIFLALIKIAKDKTKKIGEDYLLETNINDIVNLLYGREGYNQKSIERIERALQHFQLVRFELTTFDWKKKGKERLKTRVTRSIGGIVISYKYIEQTKNLIIKFNSEFFSYFLESMLTNINFTIRRQLRKDGAKALLRFLSAHTDPSRMHIMTVLNAINFNTNQPMFKLRQLFKSYIAELKKHGVLGKKTKLGADDTVFFDILPPKKALPD